MDITNIGQSVKDMEARGLTVQKKVEVINPVESHQEETETPIAPSNAKVETIDENTKVVIDPQTQEPHTIKIKSPNQSVKRSLWDIDSVGRDGQVVAGEVDEAQKEFLKKTEFVK